MSIKFKRIVLFSFLIFGIILASLIISLNLKTSRESQDFLEESIRSELISTASAAREMIDVDTFVNLKSADEARSSERHKSDLANLRSLAEHTNAKYIYALKEIDGELCFVYDTDTENDTLFTQYDMDEDLLPALEGVNSVKIGYTDEFGSFNSAVLPIYQNGRVVGVVGADLEDHLFVAHKEAIQKNMIILIVFLAVILIAMTIALLLMFKQLQKLHDRLEQQAKYDKLTKLPNRQFLMEQLDAMTKPKRNSKFALLFVDLDNFKSVNDNAGHDAGDRLLVCIAEYLKTLGEVGEAYRPSAGKLNVAARIGGDEFILIAHNIDTIEKADELAANLLAGFGKLDNEVSRYVEKYGVGLSVGVALYPYHANDYNVIIKYADIAMYHAKNSGKNQYMIYSDDLAPKPEK